MPASQKQMDFIDSLANELGMNRKQRNDFISLRVGWEVHYLDELAVIEASNVIQALLDARSSRKLAQVSLEDDEDLDELGARNDDEFNPTV